MTEQNKSTLDPDQPAPVAERPPTEAEIAAELVRQTHQSTLQTPDETAKKTTTKAKASQQGQGLHGTNKVSVKTGRGIAWAALVISVVSVTVVAIGYWHWQQQQIAFAETQNHWQQMQLSQQKVVSEQLTDQINVMKVREQQLEKNLHDSLQSELQTDLQARLKTTVNDRFVTIEQQLSELQVRRPQTWLLAEANFLIRMAGRKLWLENDIGTASQMLANADFVVSGLNDPSLLPLRKQISADIALLNSLPNPRITDTYLGLSGLITTVDKMVVNTIDLNAIKSTASSQHPLSEGPVSGADRWGRFTRKVSDFFSRMFFVDYGMNATDIEALKTPQQQWHLKANLKIKLLQAQVAILSRDQRVFKDSIEQALAWLALFNQTDPSIQAARATLTSIVELAIEARYPDQLASQVMIEQLMQSRTQAPIASAPASVTTPPASPEATPPVSPEATPPVSPEATLEADQGQSDSESSPEVKQGTGL